MVAIRRSQYTALQPSLVGASCPLAAQGVPVYFNMWLNFEELLNQSFHFWIRTPCRNEEKMPHAD